MDFPMDHPTAVGMRAVPFQWISAIYPMDLPLGDLMYSMDGFVLSIAPSHE
jgi:hypothetical protein